MVNMRNYCLAPLPVRLCIAAVLLFAAAAVRGDVACDLKQPPPTDYAQFCDPVWQNETDSSFTADPEVRFFNGSYFMTYTAIWLTLPSTLSSHILMAKWSRDGNCWSNITKVTYNDNPPVSYNEVSTFTILENGTIAAYYLHTQKVDGVYNVTFDSIRLKKGIMVNSLPVFEPDVIYGRDTSDWEQANVFALWAMSASPDIPFVLHKKFHDIGCYTLTEPSVLQVAGNLVLSIGCYDLLLSKAMGTKLVVTKLDDLTFRDADLSLGTKFAIAPHTFCSNNPNYTAGMVAGTLIAHNGTNYIAVSPTGNGQYYGCIWYKLGVDGTKISVDSTPVGAIAKDSPHAGSCTGGAMTAAETDRPAFDIGVWLFYQPNHTGQYHIMNASWPV